MTLWGFFLILRKSSIFLSHFSFPIQAFFRTVESLVNAVHSPSETPSVLPCGVGGVVLVACVCGARSGAAACGAPPGSAPLSSPGGALGQRLLPPRSLAGVKAWATAAASGPPREHVVGRGREPGRTLERSFERAQSRA